MGLRMKLLLPVLLSTLAAAFYLGWPPASHAVAVPGAPALPAALLRGGAALLPLACGIALVVRRHEAGRRRAACGREHAAEILFRVAEGTALDVREDFFRSLVRHFAAALQVREAFVTACADSPASRVRTLAYWSGQGFADNIEFDLADTPCERVIREGRVHYCPRGLASRYPGEQGRESYLGIPIADRSGRVVGHLAFRDDRPMGDEVLLPTVYKIFTARAATEIQRMGAEEALYGEKERAQVTLASIGDAVITADAQGRIDFLNPVAARLTGRSPAEAAGRPLDEFFRDVSRERELTRKLAWQASHDALTGIPNRREFEKRLGEAIAAAKRDGTRHALLYLDLDQFKVVNDTGGHMAGDELLRQLSVLLREPLRPGDTLARLGGDEFGVLLADCPPDKARRIADKLLQVLAGFRFAWEDRLFEVGTSIGVVPIDAESRGVMQIMTAADEACYAAKGKGRNRIHVFEEGDAELAWRRSQMEWVARINEALRENRFRLYRQPIMPTRADGREPGHYEVLLRLQNADGSILPPQLFIPAAEQYDLMPAVDRWVIRTLFASQNAALAARRRPGEPCACLYTINLSGATLNDETFPAFIREQMAAHDVPAGAVCFEITETAAIANLAKASAFMKEFVALGCHFYLDDFGSGLSSFAYLKNLPVDYLKIDGAFVRNMVDDSVDCAMVEAINRVGHVMGIRTVAEFVEDEATFRRLQSVGVDFAQGYCIGKPEPIGA